MAAQQAMGLLVGLESKLESSNPEGKGANSLWLVPKERYSSDGEGVVDFTSKIQRLKKNVWPQFQLTLFQSQNYAQKHEFRFNSLDTSKFVTAVVQTEGESSEEKLRAKKAENLKWILTKKYTSTYAGKVPRRRYQNFPPSSMRSKRQV